MKVAKAKRRLRGKQPKLKPNHAKHLLELHDLGTYNQTELAEFFGVGRSTIYRTIERVRPRPVQAERPFAYLEAPTASPDLGRGFFVGTACSRGGSSCWPIQSADQDAKPYRKWNRGFLRAVNSQPLLTSSRERHAMGGAGRPATARSSPPTRRRTKRLLYLSKFDRFPS